MKYTKEDIEKAFKTTPIEDSLLVFQADDQKKRYIEYAIIKLDDIQLEEATIKNWIDGIDRLRDLYIYGNANPLRIRLKNSFYPIGFEVHPEPLNFERISEMLLNLDLSFDVQKPPLFKVMVYSHQKTSFLCLVYHHLLFDGISVQMALSSLNPANKINYTEWAPTPSNLPEQKIDIKPFLLGDFTPPVASPLNKHLRQTLDIDVMSYENLMLKWIEFIQKASGCDEVVLGEVISARNNEPGASQALGYLVQTWPLVFSGPIDKSKLQSVRSERISKASEWVKSHYTQNCFDHCWVLEPHIDSEFESKFYSAPHYLLAIAIKSRGENLSLEFCWNLEKIEANAANTIFTAFQSHLSAEDKTNFDIEGIEHKYTSILDKWDEIVTRFPNEIAVEDSLGTRLTFKTLDAFAEGLAFQLDIKKNECVGVYTDYTAAIPVSFLAILKKGGIYVPLDPTVSDDRRNHIISDAKVTKVISDLNPNFSSTIIHPFGHATDVSLEPLTHDLSDTCYLIYTSGTTGEPKGCAVNHRNLLNLFVGTQSLFNFQIEDQWILAHSYGFDFSTWEIWGALLNGSKLFIPSRLDVQDAFKFHQILIDKKVTILNQTPKSFYNLMLIDEAEHGLSSLRIVIFGGDKLQTERLADWVGHYSDTKMVNMYGITETTVHVTYHEIMPEPHSNIGRALPGYNMQLVNKNGEVIPEGFVGEIYVYGLGVCNGYYGKKELSNEKFGQIGHLPFYRTGDLAWKIADNYYYLGRKDRQVKIRGYRIELGEIEFLLKKNQPGCDFIVLLLDQKLIGFYKGGSQELDGEKFRTVMADYAIPSKFIKVNEFPLNQSGKIDEKQLLSHIDGSIKMSNHSAFDDSIASLFKEFLGDGIEENKSFLQNGGDSILAIRMINAFKKKGYQITAQALFDAVPLNEIQVQNTLEELKISNYLKQFNHEQGFEFSELRFRFPLQEAQLGILYDTLKSNSKSLYVEQLCYEIPAHYSFTQIYNAYALVCKYNPLLNSKIERVQGTYLFSSGQSDFTPCIEYPIGTDRKALLEDDFNQGFDLENNLSRLLVICGKERHEVIWTHHHLLLDGWSLAVFSQLILQALKGIELKYNDAFIQNACKTHLQKNKSTYWQKIEDWPKSESLIPVLPERNDSSPAYIKKSFHIPFNNWDVLKDLNVSSYAYAFSSWTAFIACLFRKNDLALGQVVSLRTSTDMDELGMYIRTLPFGSNFDHELDFQSYLQMCFKTLLIDQEHKDDSFIEYLKGSALEHLFVFENYPVNFKLLEDEGITIGEFREMTGAAWTTVVYPKINGFEFSIMFQTQSYSAHYVDHIMSHFKDWQLGLDWSLPLSKSVGHLKRELISSGPNVILREKNTLEILKTTSEYPALAGIWGEIQYDNLWEQAKSWAHALKSQHIVEGESVGIDVESTLHFTVATLAIWLAGGNTCSVDKRYPKNRKEFIYKNAHVRFILESKEGQIDLQKRDLQPSPQDSGVSFILHTSGSTGEPKGVIQTHKCLLNLIKWNAQSFGMGPHDRILQLSSFGFDASLHEILLALCIGSTLIEVPLEDRLDIHQIKKFIVDFKVTTAWIPARLLNAILDIDQDFFTECESLKRIITTGEALVIGSSLKNYLKKSNIQLLNYYGPTETHVITAQSVNYENASTQPGIGLPLPNCQIQLIQADGTASFLGLPGEIWAAGKNLALGYLNDPIQSQEKFNNGFYKTGDWAFVDSESIFNFMGRRDDQIKIRGFRVEPLEVERNITALSEVNQCCILVESDSLHAFIVSNTSLEHIKEQLALALPDYMIPNSWHLLEAMPINNNGKADRQALKTILASSKNRNGQSLDHSKLSTQCWQAILGHLNFDVTTPFENSGGHSILLMKMQAWIEKHTGTFVSVRDLLVHNTPELLEVLLNTKKDIGAPIKLERFPINSLQKDILISEIGNEYEHQSPFVLRFRAKTKVNIEQGSWKSAVLKLLDSFPYLGFILQHSINPHMASWQKAETLESILNPFEGNPIHSQEPLIRFINHGNQNIEIVWHHILLDGLGIQVLLKNFVDMLSGKAALNEVWPKELISFKPSQKKINISNCSKQALLFQKKINGSTLEELKLFCSSNQIQESHFLYFSIALAHEELGIAAADVENHPGVPGMFTELKPFYFNLQANSLKDSFIEKPLTPLDIQVVANFMTLESSNNELLEMTSDLPTRTKYPYEWQFIRDARDIEVTFYASIEDPHAGSIFIKWEHIFTELITGAWQPKTSSPKPTDIFDNFDF